MWVTHYFIIGLNKLMGEIKEDVRMKKKKILVPILLSMTTICGGTQSEAIWQLDEVNVVGERYDADIAQVVPVASGLVGTIQEVGTLGKKDVLDVPFQQMTFTKQAMETFSHPGRSAMDVLSLSPSVRTTKGSMDTNLYIRGFSAGSGSWMLNGIPSMSHQMTMPTNYMDKIEVLSGPNIGINGVGIFMAGSIGGTVSATTKKAQDKPNFSTGLSWASDSYFIQSVDWGKRFGTDNEWGIRFNALNATGDMAVDGTRDYKRVFAINIDNRTEENKTNIFFSYDYDDQYGRSNTIGLGSLPRLPKTPKNTNNLSPKWSNDKYENTTFILNREQYLNKNLTWFANFGWRWEKYSSWLQQWSGRVLQDMDGNYKGTYTQMPVFHHYTYVNTGVKGNFMLGDWHNEWIASIDFTRFSRYRDNNVTSANKYPIVGNIYTGRSSKKPSVVWDPITHNFNSIMRGWTVVNTISSPNKKLHLTFGYHGHEVDNTNYVNNSRVKSDAKAPILGLTYKFTPKMVFYASHMENFVEGKAVGNRYTNRGDILPPTKTKQNEFGLKFKNGMVLNTLSFYEIKKENGMAVPNSDGTETYKLDGQQKNKGIEFSSAGSFGKKWSYILGVAYMNSKQMKTYKGLNDGRSVDAMPKWTTDLSLIYKPDDNLRLIGRLEYVGNSLIRNTNSYTKSLEIAGQTILDLGVSWDTRFGKHPVTLSAWCYNLLDKEYWYASGGNNIGLGAPGAFAISAKVNF